MIYYYQLNHNLKKYKMTTIKVKVEAKLIYFSAVNENRASFLMKFADGSDNFSVKGSNNYDYKIRIETLSREDGSGQRFLFTATIVHAKSPTGLSNRVSEKYTGYFDARNKSGWIKSV
jgi:hypothetical protein